MIKIKVLYGSSIFNATWQNKSFKDEISCIEWCRKNCAKIGCINNYRTFFQHIPHFVIIDAIRGMAN